jgi:hypothetical protein
MAQDDVAARKISIRLSYELFTVSETCYRPEGKHNAEIESIVFLHNTYYAHSMARELPALCPWYD